MNIAAFLIYCVIVTFTPGPTNVAILSIAHHFGLYAVHRLLIYALSCLLSVYNEDIRGCFQTNGHLYVVYSAIEVLGLV